MALGEMMATDHERDRELIRERFSRKLTQLGWEKINSNFFKGQYCLECDDIGFFFWLDGYRAAGMAWNYLPRHMPEKKITFKTGQILYID